MMKLRSKRFSRSSSKLGNNGSKGEKDAKNNGEIKWELRPGGMLVQKRESNNNQSSGEGLIAVRVSTVSQWHHISIDSTSTFGNHLIIKSNFTYIEFGFTLCSKKDSKHLLFQSFRFKKCIKFLLYKMFLVYWSTISLKFFFFCFFLINLLFMHTLFKVYSKFSF